MKRLIQLPFYCLLLLSTACNEAKVDPEPIAPIIKLIEMPNVVDAMPGSSVKIKGVGFTQNDIIDCKSTESDHSFTAEIIEVTDTYIIISLPRKASGAYSVTITRDDKQTKLSELLKVAEVIIIDNLKVPTEIFAAAASVTISGEGFEEGDIVEMTSEYYPATVKHEVETTYSAGSESESECITFTIPDECYGVNKLRLTRDVKTCDLGTISIAVAAGDQIGGGVVYYTSDDGVHGLIVSANNKAVISVGSAKDQWGPATIAGAVDADKYQSKANTAACVECINKYRTSASDWDDLKTAAELCAEYEVTQNDIVYNDWCLPANDALVELFNARATLGLTVTKNNYWTSTEASGNDTETRAYYVNFYEATNLVNNTTSKTGWKIGIIPIRQF